MLFNGTENSPKNTVHTCFFFLSTFFSPSYLIYYQKKRRKYCKHFYLLSPCDINFWCVNMMAWTKWNEFWSIFLLGDSKKSFDFSAVNRFRYFVILWRFENSITLQVCKSSSVCKNYFRKLRKDTISLICMTRGSKSSEDIVRQQTQNLKRCYIVI